MRFRSSIPLARVLAALCLLLGLTAGHSLAADLSPIELRWLKAAWPVLKFAEAERMPLDIVVQPQPAPGRAPLAMAFIGGRCKLVLSMRGNPLADTALDSIEPDLAPAAIELMAAHELGHCKRHLDGQWHRSAPLAFAADDDAARPVAELRAARREMRATRCEEGYADMVGLAWTLREQPQLYPRLRAWLEAERRRGHVPGAHHDTLAWIALPGLEAALAGRSIFDAASTLWSATESCAPAN